MCLYSCKCSVPEVGICWPLLGVPERTMAQINEENQSESSLSSMPGCYKNFTAVQPFSHAAVKAAQWAKNES